MTRPDLDEREEEQILHKQAVSQAVVEVVKQGTQEDRVTCGADQCVDLLGSCPDDIMLCLLAKRNATQDAAVKIKHVLLEAYCYENEISLLRIENGQMKLKELLQSCQGPPAPVSGKPVTEESADLKQPVEMETEKLKHPTEVSDGRQEEGDITNSLFDEAIGGQLTSRKGYTFRLPVDEMSQGVPVTGASGAYSSLQGSTVEPVAEHDHVDSPLKMCNNEQSTEKPQTDVDKAAAAADSVDYGCIMIKYPQHGRSQEDELVTDYVDHELRNYIEPWVTLPDLHHIMPVQAQLPPPKPISTSKQDEMAVKLLQEPLHHEETTSPPPDICQWSMVKLKEKYKAK